jgi:hypothetical protein
LSRRPARLSNNTTPMFTAKLNTRNARATSETLTSGTPVTSREMAPRTSSKIERASRSAMSRAPRVSNLACP